MRKKDVRGQLIEEMMIKKNLKDKSCDDFNAIYHVQHKETLRAVVSTVVIFAFLFKSGRFLTNRVIVIELIFSDKRVVWTERVWSIVVRYLPCTGEAFFRNFNGLPPCSAQLKNKWRYYLYFTMSSWSSHCYYVCNGWKYFIIQHTRRLFFGWVKIAAQECRGSLITETLGHSKVTRKGQVIA
jgi:hypothetical protein